MKQKTKRTAFGTLTYKEYLDLAEALSRKEFLTIYETSVYFGVGTNALYQLVKRPDVDFVIPNGRQRLISRERFRKFMLDGNLKKG